MKRGILSLGEALVDFVPLDLTNQQYQKSPGGAPANVAVGVAKLGGKATFIGKVGNDGLGSFLYDTFMQYGVRTEHMKFTKEAKTGLVFVSNTADGERSFEFLIEPSADQLFSVEDLDVTEIKEHKIVHFGSISLIHKCARAATLETIRLAQEHDGIVSFDPNVRLDLWPSEEVAREMIQAVLSKVDVLKLSKEELVFLTGDRDIQQGVAALSIYDIPIILVTMGAEGSYVCMKDNVQFVPATAVEAVDTTGAGDAYMSCILYLLDQYEGEWSLVSITELVEMATYASVSGGLATQAKGAMTALPSLAEIEEKLDGRL
ncbi:aminoimidazole riboside kinase [Pontibacillus litoralis]|uniref:Fructokinase n=1 Tax=Pontibacillus litoralis JSM 072002 TaxID=1385512 RepID=A0A0A5G4S9_9BACI|nr:aminoimidazole riboside kinase [Pontibacillus litoralis]KGX87034.1 fructokinase [Pontibacillus litoralis JSM 072002]